jgi:hypothetical protein
VNPPFNAGTREAYAPFRPQKAKVIHRGERRERREKRLY